MASSRLNRALTIRDHVLRLIEERGALWPDEAIRIITWEAKPLLFVLQTLVPESRKKKPAPFHELAVFCGGRRLMLLAWSNADTPQLISFIPGEWEHKAVAMA
jgi:hypothetical protein